MSDNISTFISPLPILRLRGGGGCISVRLVTHASLLTDPPHLPLMADTDEHSGTSCAMHRSVPCVPCVPPQAPRLTSHSQAETRRSVPSQQVPIDTAEPKAVTTVPTAPTIPSVPAAPAVPDVTTPKPITASAPVKKSTPTRSYDYDTPKSSGYHPTTYTSSYTYSSGSYGGGGCDGGGGGNGGGGGGGGC